MKLKTLSIILLSFAALFSCTSGKWSKPSVYADAYRLPEGYLPEISFDGEAYTIHDWYGVEGYDLEFRTYVVEDSTAITITNADSTGHGYYYVKTGLEDLPVAGVSTDIFEPNHTILSGFWGDRDKGRVWMYVYLYDSASKWVGGHLYTLYWGEGPEKPLWSTTGTCTLVGGLEPIQATLEAYSGNRYILRNWYGVDHYDLEFRDNGPEGIEMLDYYWKDEDGVVSVQCRHSKVANAGVPQAEPNGSLVGGPDGGCLRFEMGVYGWNDGPIDDPDHPEFLFEW